MQTDEKTEGLIIAAGYSSRAGGFKPAFELRGKPLIIHSIESMRPFCERIVVVGGYKFDRLRELMSEEDVILIRNDRYRKGMFSSVQRGVREIHGARFFFLPGDIPLVSGAVFRRMLACDARIVIPSCGDRKGHPVLMSSGVIADITGTPEDSNLREVIERVGYRTVPVEDENIFRDVDTPDDYIRLKQDSELGDSES